MNAMNPALQTLICQEHEENSLPQNDTWQLSLLEADFGEEGVIEHWQSPEPCLWRFLCRRNNGWNTDRHREGLQLSDWEDADKDQGFLLLQGESRQTGRVLHVSVEKDRTIDLYWRGGECWWERKRWLKIKLILFFSREKRRENVCSYSTQQIKDLVIYHQNNRPGL